MCLLPLVVDAVRTASTPADVFRQVFFRDPISQAEASSSSQPFVEPLPPLRTGALLLRGPGPSRKSSRHSSQLVDVVLPCEEGGQWSRTRFEVPWILQVMLGFTDLRLACLEELHRDRSRLSQVATYVHNGSLMILTNSKYQMGLDVAANTELSNLTLIHIGDLSPQPMWAQEYHRWGFVFRNYWMDDANQSFGKLIREERLAYFPLGAPPTNTVGGKDAAATASKRPLKIFTQSTRNRSGELHAAQVVLGKDLVVGASQLQSSGSLARSALCLQIPEDAVESLYLYESLEAGCIPVLVLAWSQAGDPFQQLQDGEALPFLFVQSPGDLPQVLRLSDVELDSVQAQCQAWWMATKQRYRAKFQEVLRPRPGLVRPSLPKHPFFSGLVVYLMLAMAAIGFGGCKLKEDSHYQSEPALAVEGLKLACVGFTIVSHFFLGPSMDRTSCAIWKLVAISGALMQRWPVQPLKRYFANGSQCFLLYQLSLVGSVLISCKWEILPFWGLQTWQVPWQAECQQPVLDLENCVAYRMNAPLWPLPGLFFCWALYPAISALLDHLHALAARRSSPCTMSNILLGCSAGFYWLSMSILDLPFSAFPPMFLAPFLFGVFGAEWLSTLGIVARCDRAQTWAQCALPVSMLMHQVIPGLPDAWNFPLLLPLVAPMAKPKMHGKGCQDTMRVWLVRFGRGSLACYLLQPPAAQLLLFAWQYLDWLGIMDPAAKAPGSFGVFPQMNLASFLVYLAVLWSFSFLCARWL